MPTTEQLFRNWEVDFEFNKPNGRGSEHTHEPPRYIADYPTEFEREVARKLERGRLRAKLNKGTK